MYWIRLRAYVTSICYLMNPIDPSWLPYETAEWFIDTLYWLINFRADGHRPGLKALVQAYTQTMADFAVAVQNDGVKLGDLMKEKSTWVHYWKEGIASFDDTSKRGEKRGLDGSAESTEAVINRTMQNTQTMVRHLQSRVDSLTRGNGGGGGRGNQNRNNSDRDGGNGSARTVHADRNGNANGNNQNNKGGGKGGNGNGGNRFNGRARGRNPRGNRSGGGGNGGNSNGGGNAA